MRSTSVRSLASKLPPHTPPGAKQQQQWYSPPPQQKNCQSPLHLQDQTRSASATGRRPAL
eukprot:5807487-Prorocentrum_lima.AAC.1